MKLMTLFKESMQMPWQKNLRMQMVKSKFYITFHESFVNMQDIEWLKRLILQVAFSLKDFGKLLLLLLTQSSNELEI